MLRNQWATKSGLASHHCQVEVHQNRRDSIHISELNPGHSANQINNRLWMWAEVDVCLYISRVGKNNLSFHWKKIFIGKRFSLEKDFPAQTGRKLILLKSCIFVLWKIIKSWSLKTVFHNMSRSKTGLRQVLLSPESSNWTSIWAVQISTAVNLKQCQTL